MDPLTYGADDQFEDASELPDTQETFDYDSEDEVTDFVRENVRKYSGIIEDKPKKKKRPKSFSFFSAEKKEKLRANILKGKPKRNKVIIAEAEKTIHELEQETQYIDQEEEDLALRKMPQHEWVSCQYKTATFCMICGKLTSQLGEVPIDDQNNVPAYVYRQGPNVSREGLRCQICLMNIHIECLEKAQSAKISMACIGRPDPRSQAGHFIREGIGNFNFSRHLSICDTSKFSHRDSLTSVDPLDQIDESYKILKQGKALRLVQTGEDVREGKSAKKSIADPVFWKSLFMKRGSIAPDAALGVRREKKGFFGKLGSRSLKIPKSVDKQPYCALYGFDAREKHDISLRPGDKVYVFDSKDDNWWFGRKEPINQGMVGYFPAKFVMKIEETEKPFLVVKHCFGNSRRKELKAKENTIVMVNYAQPIQRDDCLFVRSLDGEGFVPKDVIKPI